MPLPSDVHVNQYLTSVSVAFAQDASKFVADVVFPTVPVPKQSNFYATFPIGDFLRSNMQKRGPGSAAAEATYTVSKDQYFCDVWSLAKLIDDQEVANQDTPFDANRDTTVFLTQQELIKREEDWVTSYFATGIWGQDLVGGTDFTRWDDVASDPIGDIETACAVVEAKTGFWPTDLTISRPVWNALKNHPDVIARLNGGATPQNTATVTRMAFAGLVELERINLAAAVKNSGLEGAADSLGYIAGKHGLLTYRPASAGLLIPSAGYTFTWSGLEGAADGRRILKYRVDEKHSDKIEIETAWQHKTVSTPLGVFFSGAVS